MQQPFFSWYKIALQVEDPLSLLRLLLFSKKHSNLSLLPMGNCYKEARVLGPFCNNPIDYAIATPRSNRTGIMSAKRMHTIYHYSTISSATKLYALIGMPTEKSIGHLFHNYLFHRQNMDALYIRIDVHPSQVAVFLELAAQFPFSGFSVTTPLKEDVFTLLSHFDEECKRIGATNTLLWKEKQYIGYNSDGKGALDLFDSVENKKILLLGAGGAAKAIAFEAAKRGATLFWYNRTKSRLLQLAKRVNAKMVEAPIEYDIAINTTPYFEEKWVQEEKTLLDIRQRPKETDWIRAAKKQRGKYCFGREMFIRQAILQNYLWRFKEKWSEDLHLYENVLPEYFLTSLAEQK